MAAIDFPASPTNGQVFTSGDKVWVYSTATTTWNLQTQTITGPSGGWNTSQTLRSITGATDTPTSSDLGKLLLINTTSGVVTITINSSLGLTAGERIDFMWVGAASSVTFSASSTIVNGSPGLNLYGRYSAATLVCTASNTYVLVGNLIA